MARAIHRLSAPTINNKKEAGYYADGGNLYLRIAPGGTKGWIFRFALDGKTRDAGLGPYPTVGLKEAREEAHRWRQLVAKGIDPIEARKEEQQAARLDALKATSFEQCAEAFIESHEAGWQSEKHRRQWRSTLATYVFPVMGKASVGAIDTTLVQKALDPLWTSKPETAVRVRGRIESILDWAKVRGHREGENPARWRGHLDQLLPAKAKVRSVVHHAALPYREIATFAANLRADENLTARAMEFLILSATRMSETLNAVWKEIDLYERMWTIPVSRMKAGREHRVPLSARAIAILTDMAEIRQSDFVFPGAKKGEPFSPMALPKLLDRMGYADITVHGFRSTFRDWAAECTTFPREAAEMALAHAVPSAVEAAYRRGDMLEKRRQLMEEWGTYCCGKSDG